jgi:glycosyltransferase involved in cell wall biosynthesis
MNKTEKTPKVSVCVITYNHEKYIRQCLQSILDQETNFDFEVIVGDDCSTDGTRAIVQEFVERYPIVVKPIYQEKNIDGGSHNFLTVHRAAIGEYVAHVDGDDYCLPGKLQYQSDVLDADEKVVQCWTCANVVTIDNSIKKVFPSKFARLLYPVYLKPEDLVLSYALVGQHSTQMYRRSARDVNLIKGAVLDYYVAFLISLHGISFYSKKIFSAYRVNSTDSITKNNLKTRVTVDLLSEHLFNIANNHPIYIRFALANLTVRRFFSCCAGHDLSKIDQVRAKLPFRFNVFLVIKSAFYFLLQKI